MVILILIFMAKFQKQNKYSIFPINPKDIYRFCKQCMKSRLVISVQNITQYYYKPNVINTALKSAQKLYQIWQLMNLDLKAKVTTVKCFITEKYPNLSLFHEINFCFKYRQHIMYIF